MGAAPPTATRKQAATRQTFNVVSLREMVDNLSKTKAYLHLFTPSGIGMVFYVFIAAMVIILRQVPFIQQYLDLPANIEFMRIFTLWLDQTLNGLLGEGRTNAIVVGLFWAIVGLAVYTFLQALARFISEIGEGVEQEHYVWPKGSSRIQPLKQAVERGIFRLVAFGVLVYVVLQPLARLAHGAPFKDSVGTNEIMQYVLWFLSLCLMLHIAVVLTRLVALRARLFG